MRGAHGGDYRFACGRAERAAEKVEILHGGNNSLAIEIASAGKHGINHAGLAASVFQPVGIAALVTELERIGGDLGQRQAFILAFVEQEL